MKKWYFKLLKTQFLYICLGLFVLFAPVISNASGKYVDYDVNANRITVGYGNSIAGTYNMTFFCYNAETLGVCGFRKMEGSTGTTVGSGFGGNDSVFISEPDKDLNFSLNTIPTKTIIVTNRVRAAQSIAPMNNVNTAILDGFTINYLYIEKLNSDTICYGLNSLNTCTDTLPIEQIQNIFGAGGLMGTSTNLLANVTAGVIDTSVNLWPLFSLLGVIVAFYIAYKLQTFIMAAGEERRLKEKYHSDLANENNLQKQWILTEKYQREKRKLNGQNRKKRKKRVK